MPTPKSTKKPSSKTKRPSNQLLTQGHKISIYAAMAFIFVLTAAGIGVKYYSSAVTYGGQQMDTYDAQFITIVNNYRAAHGLVTLAVHAGLQDTARTWSATLAAQNKLYHDPSAWNTVAGCSWWGEIAYQGNGSPQDAFNNYMSDTGHRAIIVDPSYRYIGSATADRASIYDQTDKSGRVKFNVIHFARACTAKTSTVIPRAVTPIAVPLGATATIAGYESRDSFAYAGHYGTGVSASMSWPLLTTGDDPVQVTVANTVLGATGSGGLIERQAVNYARTTRVNVRISHNQTGKIIPVVVSTVDEYTGAYTMGTINVTSTSTYYSLAVPAGAKFYANHIRLITTGASLARLSTSLGYQKATFNIYGISASN